MWEAAPRASVDAILASPADWWEGRCFQPGKDHPYAGVRLPREWRKAFQRSEQQACTKEPWLLPKLLSAAGFPPCPAAWCRQLAGDLDFGVLSCQCNLHETS